ncbi:MAG: hypothetical protein AAF387_17740 [Pseudomonadota bacterium]
MPLLDDFQTVLARLAYGGWDDLFTALELDINAADFASKLVRAHSNPQSVLALDGFEDISPQAFRAIEPGSPANSFLFHALGSPAVLTAPDGTPFTEFPTPAELDLAENVVFGIQQRSLEDIRSQLPLGAKLAVGVFAREYRNRAATSHGMHADMVFSRTGISRVGTSAPHWDGAKRAFSPLEPGDNIFSFRVLPCRYGVYLAVQLEGDESNFGPYKADRALQAHQQFQLRDTPQATVPDAEQRFWVPLHKLFSGDECLKQLSLTIDIEAEHANVKLAKIHERNMGQLSNIPDSFASGFKPPATDSEPFTIRQDLADFLDSNTFGEGVISPIPKNRLVEPTMKDGLVVGTKVPPSSGAFASFSIGPRTIPPDDQSARSAPEYVHVRTRVFSDGTTTRDLNESENVRAIVASGKHGNADPYTAHHYTDFAGDGWVSTKIAGLPGHLDRRIPAYSILAAPDFYPYVSQSELLDWALGELRSIISKRVWRVPPLTLADQRAAPNLDLRRFNAPFVPADVTVSAMVGLYESAKQADSAFSSAQKIPRVTSLPDGAAGFYAPGWDTSLDYDDEEDQPFLAAHGLGSPFPEDAKLCAAISAYWPSVAPDTSRSYGWQYQNRIVAPMTDKEIGLEGAPPWDGIVGTRRVQSDSGDFLEVEDFDHLDYIKTALANQFTLSETMKVTQEEYQARIIAWQRLASRFNVDDRNTSIQLLHFRDARPTDPDLAAAENAHFQLTAPVYEIVLAVVNGYTLVQDAVDKGRWFRRSRIAVEGKFFVGDDGRMIFKFNDDDWEI